MCDIICNEAVPFRPYCAGVATRTRNVSEYMLVLALCLVVNIALIFCALGFPVIGLGLRLVLGHRVSVSVSV